MKHVTAVYVKKKKQAVTNDAMSALAEAVREVNVDGGADVTKPFFYLAGPMSGYEAFNAPAFKSAAMKLRNAGFNIVNPSQLDVEEQRATKDPNDVAPGTLEWQECLRRDLGYVLHPNCQGVIAIDGWEESKGAKLETYNAYAMGLEVLKFEPAGHEEFDLFALERKDELD